MLTLLPDIFFWIFVSLLGLKLLWESILLIAFFRNKKFIPKNDKPGVSVIVCAHNEEDNLMQHLPLILEQNYPTFEVIVVNHASTDSTPFVLNTLSRQYKHLHVIDIHDSAHHRPGKKTPLTVGIKAAKFEQILVTDSDCVPVGKHWISSMAAGFEKGNLVLGYSPIARGKSLVNLVARLDVNQTAVQYLSFAKLGLPYMGVGRNMAYKSDLFFSIGGFRTHYAIPSGDDDLFVNEVAKQSKTTVVVSPDSTMYTESPKSLYRWVLQKKRHFSTGVNYRFFHKVMLSAHWSIAFLVILASIAALFTSFMLPTLGALAVYYLVKVCFYFLYGKKLHIKSDALLMPLYETLSIFLHPILYISQRFYPVTGW
jgi:cellulose synthase/poly-beta-1,6-N-acetylglucosamine synthase-like glycosyltransferase